MATACASRTIQPAVAFLIITVGAMLGPLIAGTAVALTIGHGIVDYGKVGFVPLAAGLLGGGGAVLLAYAFRVPTTASVALVSATVGSLWALGESHAILWPGVGKVAYSLIGSLVVGFAAGAVFYTVAWLALARTTFRGGMQLMRLQYLTVLALAVGYGSNDAEKMMGLIVAAMTLSGAAPEFSIPFWVIAVSVLSFAAGMAFGGLRVAKTIGGKLFRIRPLHALCFQLAAAATVLTASAFGGPLSTTECTASAILGTGAAANPRGLRWQVARDLVAAWFLTVPAGLACGLLATLILRPVFHRA